MQNYNIFWFRRDLRLHDNRGLFEALNSDKPVIPIFIFDTNILSKLKNKKDHRVEFIHTYLNLIQQKLNTANTYLHVFHGDPIEIYKQIIKQWKIGTVFTNHDYEPYATKRDRLIADLLSQNGIEFKTFKDQVIFEKDEVVKDDGSFYSVYTPYMKKWKEVFKKTKFIRYPSEKKTDKIASLKPKKSFSIEDIGFSESGLTLPAKTIKKDILLSYKEKRDFPALDHTSHLGVHLRFGTVSVRDLVEKAIELKAETWLSELIWREFFMQILWHNPRVIGEPFKEKYSKIKWRDSEKDFLAWCEGRTGYPIVDAGMRELNNTGHMHNRVRMVTASFLVKHLLIDWRKGEQYFAEKLFDFDLSANNGNWQWVAGCGCDAAPYFRIFNPDSQQEKFDKDFKYIEKWVPEYKTKKYAEPIVNHAFARNRALKAFEVLKS